MTTQGEKGFDPTRTVQAEPAAGYRGFPQDGQEYPGAGQPPPAGRGLGSLILISLVMGAVASVAVAIVLWFALIKPNIKDTARDEVSARLGTSGQAAASSSTS